MKHDARNRYLFHWLGTDELEAFSRSGVLRPSWRHFILSESRFVRGTSLCEEPMLWNPDDDRPREPCLIVDRTRVDAPLHWIASALEYHLTKKIQRARRTGRDVAEILETERRSRMTTYGSEDEAFVEGPIEIGSIVAIGFQTTATDVAAEEAASRVAERLLLPTIDMSMWETGCPSVTELDGIVGELLSESVLPGLR